jgi:hypothetical protein
VKLQQQIALKVEVDQAELAAEVEKALDPRFREVKVTVERIFNAQSGQLDLKLAQLLNQQGGR